LAIWELLEIEIWNLGNTIVNSGLRFKDLDSPGNFVRKLQEVLFPRGFDTSYGSGLDMDWVDLVDDSSGTSLDVRKYD
jgi:hypothetical protein